MIAGRFDFHLERAHALGRIGVGRVVAEHVVVAGFRIDALERALEVVVVDDGDPAGFLGQVAQRALRLLNERPPLALIELLAGIDDAGDARADRW